MKDIDVELKARNLVRLDQEPIQISGQVQPHGVLLVLEEPSLKILQVSTNTQSVLRISPEQMLEKTLRFARSLSNRTHSNGIISRQSRLS